MAAVPPGSFRTQVDTPLRRRLALCCAVANSGCHSGRDLRHRQPNPGWIVRQAQATWPGSSPNCLATIPRGDSLPWPQTGSVCNLLNHNPQCGGPTPKHGCLGRRMDGPGSFQVGSARPTGGQESWTWYKAIPPAQAVGRSREWASPIASMPVEPGEPLSPRQGRWLAQTLSR